MKISRIQLPLFAVALGLAAHTSAFGASYTWDSDANATIGTPVATTPGSGTWNAANTNWNLAGTAGSDVAWVTNSDAVFAGSDGTYAITVGGSLTVGNLTFNNSGYTLSAASAVTLSQFNLPSVVTVAAGKTATIGSNVTYENTTASTISITGTAAAGGSAGTLIIDNGGKVDTTQSSSIIYVGSTTNTNGSLRATTVQVNAGGTLSSATSIVVNGLLKVNGGTVSAGGTGVIVIGNFADSNMPASANLTIDSGTVTAATGLRFGTSGGSTNSGGILNLNGGTLITPKVFSGGTASSSTVNFNGGTLKATVNNSSDFLNTNINNAVVKAGGAIIDTNTFGVTILKALIHDAGLGGTADGGLTKNSTGTLTLSGANTYTGNTTISGGTLALALAGTIANSSVITVGSTAVLDLTSKASGFSFGSGQTVKGIGTINIGSGKAVTFASGSSLTPGNSIGTLSVTGDLILASGSSSTFELGTPGTSDRTAVTGALTLGGTITLADNGGANGNGSASGGSYQIFTQTGVAGGSFGTVTNNITGTRAVVDASTSGSVYVDVYNKASAAATQTVNVGISRVGSSAKTAAVTLSNTAAVNATYTETLGTSGFSGTTSGFSTAGSATGIAGGGTGSGSLSVGIGSGLAAGSYSGTTTLGLNTEAVNSSGLGTAGIGSQTITINGQVNEYAAPLFNNISGASLTGSGTAYTVDFGTHATGIGTLTATIDLSNSIVNASFQDALKGSFNSTSATAAGFSFSGLTLTSLSVGASQGITASFVLDGVSAGTYTGNLIFSGLSSNASDLSGAVLSDITLAYTINIAAIPEPSTYAMIAGSALLGFAFWRRRRTSV